MSAGPEGTSGCASPFGENEDGQRRFGKMGREYVGDGKMGREEY